MININRDPIKSYYWQGINDSGEKVSGLIEASTPLQVKVQLYKKNILLQKLKKERNPLVSKSISKTTITLFIRHLATLVKAGMPVNSALEVLNKDQTNRQMKQLIESLKQDIDGGFSLSQALLKKNQYFSNFACSLIKAGEQTGRLAQLIEKLARHGEKIERIKRKIKQAMTYPLVVILIAVIVSTSLLIFVVPQFESLFSGFGAELPFFTQALIKLSNSLKSHYLFILVFLISISIASVHAVNTIKPVRRFIDKALLKLPLIKDSYTKTIFARFSGTLALTHAGGLPLLPSLEIVSEVLANSVYAQALEQVSEDIKLGQSIYQSLKNTDLFPPMLMQMIMIGEESGELESMLLKLADYYEEEVDNALESLSTMLEPIIITILGILVGGLIIAMYLPIFKLGSLT